MSVINGNLTFILQYLLIKNKVRNIQICTLKIAKCKGLHFKRFINALG